MAGLEVERIDDARWSLIGAWLRARGVGEVMPRDYYPPTGLMVDGCVAGFLSKTDCRTAFIGSIVSDPESTPERRRAALGALLDALKGEARASGYAVVVASPSIPSLLDRFVESGFHPVRPCTFVAGGL